jgi:hypothetical protein
MPLPLSGPLTIQDIANEFGGTVPHSLSEYYRNGGLVPSNNTGVPTSGAISIGDFYGAVNEIVVTATSAASLDLSTAFGANWGTGVPKRLIVPSGVTLGPVTSPTGMGGSLTIQNAGEIQGLGGTANSGAGGNAITANASFTLINSGAVRGGGGGGGQGGTGGTGRVTVFAGSTTCQCPCSGGCPSGSSASCGARCGPAGENCNTRTCSPVYSFFSGGAGGAGGRGTGYGQLLAAGSAGSAGGTNAGAGGTGGSGSTWATSGVTGSTGANGNFSSGLAGSAGGAAGRAVLMISGTVSVTNTGTINGAY